MENSIEFPQKSKNNYHKTQQSTHGDISKESRTVIQKDICTPMLVAALFTVSQDMDTYPSMLVYFNEILFSHLKKKGNSTICNNMHRPWKHYAKLERGRQILYNLTYMQNL